MAKTCPKCNSQISDTTKFCPQCGGKLTEMAKHCQNCGVEIGEGDKFCQSCGANLEFVERKAQKGVRGKSRVTAGVLNFFIPGMGFVYLGGPVFILSGILVFVTDIVNTILFWDKFFELSMVIAGLVINVGWAVAGDLGAQYVNKERIVSVKKTTKDTP